MRLKNRLKLERIVSAACGSYKASAIYSDDAKAVRWFFSAWCICRNAIEFGGTRELDCDRNIVHSKIVVPLDSLNAPTDP